MMFWQKYLLFLIMIPGLLIFPSPKPAIASAEFTIAQEYESPPEDPPRQIEDKGGRPADSCMPADDEQYPIALIPENTRRTENNQIEQLIPWGLTVSASPALFVYIPETTGTEAEVQLWKQRPDNQGTRRIYSDRISLPDRPGIIQINFPNDPENRLEVGELYKWNLKILCDEVDNSQNPRTRGFIQRIDPANRLAGLENVNPENLHSFYASQGIWYDALANLIEQLRSRPDDATLAENWQDLLTSVGLENLIEKPILDCCTLSATEE